MSHPTQSDTGRGSATDTVWLVGAIAVILGAIFAFYSFETELNAFLRAALIVGATVAAALMFYQTANGRTAWGYVQGSRIELRKTVWPTRQESVQTTLMIAVVVLIVALMLWGLDSFLLWAVKFLTGRG
jgi:preprotein translocase subunit SecE